MMDWVDVCGMYREGVEWRWKCMEYWEREALICALVEIYEERKAEDI
jgi:hypothetical protein